MAETPKNIARDEFVISVEHAIRRRTTKKILGDLESDWQHPLDDHAELREQFDEQVNRAIALAGWAPFHHSRKAADTAGTEIIHEPWRFYHLDRGSCLALLEKIDDVLPPDVRRGKIPGLLSGAGALIQVTWLPESSSEAPAEVSQSKLELHNQEHLAAASAAVQNLLLAAEAQGLETYWSSGGMLRDERIFELLAIPAGERVLGSIFIAPPVGLFNGGIDVKPGALRESRAAPDRWCRRVRLDEK